tara:strand:+ start:186 stop:362 length:177 start_codon:yes stop_codon:yes gene_type:complete
MMKVGDLISHKHNHCGGLGMILEIRQAIATVIWFEHEIFGEHECYEMIDDLSFFNKNI